MKTALISGVSGQDGAYLSKFLLDKGYRVIGLIRNNGLPLVGLNYLGILKSIIIEEINLLDKESLEKLFIKYKPDEFYNLAAQSSVGMSFKYPVDTFEFNTISVINILESIRLHSPKTKFYQASSSEMFGNINNEFLPLKETYLFKPASPYGISKASAHWLTINYREAYNLQACCGILFNHESCLRGENFVIKKIINTALDIKNKKVDYIHLGNLDVQRDWGYAPKFVEAMWLMLQENNLDDYLICSGEVTSLYNVGEMIFNKLGLIFKDYLKIDEKLKRNVDLEIIYGDNSKAKKEIGWDYNITLDELLSTLIEDEIKFQNWENRKL